MWSKSDKKRRGEPRQKDGVLKFYITRFNILIPIAVSVSVLLVEFYSMYYVDGKPVNCVDILRLINTVFVPTHIATTATLLYQHFSLVNYYNHNRKRISLEEMDLNAEHVGLTMIITIFLALVYVLCSIKVGLVNQIVLLVLQGIYTMILWTYGLRDKVVIYKKTVRDVVSY